MFTGISLLQEMSMLIGHPKISVSQVTMNPKQIITAIAQLGQYFYKCTFI